MSTVLNAVSELDHVPGPVELAIGVFDGVHIGHQAVIGRAMADANRANGSAVVVTFDPHPARLLRPDKAPRLLTDTAHKTELISRIGVQWILILPFDQSLAAQPPVDFIESLAHACKPLHEICVGHEWSFGKGRAGNLDLLRELGSRLGFEEVGLPAIKSGDLIVSSTAVRNALEHGDLDAARALLGRPYALRGSVVHGGQLGREIGFPTANLQLSNEQLPPDGVYCVHVRHASGTHGGVLNIGIRPTLGLPNPVRTAEAHLLDFSADLYGATLEIHLLSKIRDERKFEDLAALQAQIGRDITRARTLLANTAQPPA